MCQKSSRCFKQGGQGKKILIRPEGDEGTDQNSIWGKNIPECKTQKPEHAGQV